MLNVKLRIPHYFAGISDERDRLRELEITLGLEKETNIEENEVIYCIHKVICSDENITAHLRGLSIGGSDCTCLLLEIRKVVMKHYETFFGKELDDSINGNISCRYDIILSSHRTFGLSYDPTDETFIGCLHRIRSTYEDTIRELGVCKSKDPLEALDVVIYTLMNMEELKKIDRHFVKNITDFQNS